MENVSDELGSFVAKKHLKLMYNMRSLRFFVACFKKSFSIGFYTHINQLFLILPSCKGSQSSKFSFSFCFSVAMSIFLLVHHQKFNQTLDNPKIDLL